MKWPRHIRRHHIPIYGGRVAFCFSRADYEKCASVMGENESGIEWAKASVGVYQFYDPAPGLKCPLHLVGVFDGDPGTSVHELVHVACAVLRHAGVPITKENDEVLAHLMDELVSLSIKNAAIPPSRHT